MYTEQNKGFTVITNFGCDCHCKYCITKYHPILQNAVTDKSKIDWDYLEKCIAASEAPTVNLSGGGDPFYHWQENIDFYNRMYELAIKYGKKIGYPYQNPTDRYGFDSEVPKDCFKYRIL